MDMANYKAVVISAAAALLLLTAGCSTEYDILAQHPDYTVSGKNYNRTATLEVLSSGNAKLDAAFMDCLKKSNYQDIIIGSHYKGSTANPVRIVAPLNWNMTTYNCKDGIYLESRVIVMVRKPGRHTADGLQYPKPRYFQAFAQKNIGDDEATPEHWQDTLEQAMENLFTIDEFQQALEP